MDWSKIILSYIPIHSNTYGLKWIDMHPNKASGNLVRLLGAQTI
jgi:hypothetical protein